ncbi:TonB-dependent receptor [Sphingosinicellaceae bacterium]|nr:TonB-dependent receptor [Sphingosinicellaceae bacterium]
MSNSKLFSIVLVAAAYPVVPASAQTAPVQLADNNVAGGEIIVTARRRSETAREEQRLAPNLVDIQAAEEIVKYPDFNAAESLGRVPGVSLAIDTGEGRFVNIRGIDGNLNGATFGGVVLLNTQPGGTYFGGGGRAVELDTIPIGAVDRLIVRKTGMPDQEAEGLGGSVELSPRTASGIKKSFVDLTFGGGYQPAHDSGKVYRLDGAAATRFGPDKSLGIVLYGSYHEDHRGFDDLEAGYVDAQGDGVPDKAFDSADLRRYNYNRRRFGFGGELSYDPSPENHFYLRATDAGYTESVNRQLLNYQNLGDPGANASLIDPANPNGFIAPNANARLTLRDEQETHLNFVAAAGGRNDLGAVIIDYQVAYTSATYHRDYDRNRTFSRAGAPFSVAYDNITNPDFPSIVPTGFNPNDPGQFTLSRFNNATERAHDREYSGVIDVTVPIKLIAEDETIKFGGKLRLRDKIDAPHNFNYAPPPIALTSVLGAGPFGFYDDHYAIGYNADAVAVRSGLAGTAATPNLARDNSAFFNDTENVYAGYGEYNATFGKFTVLAGVRVEVTDATYRGITDTIGADGNDNFTPSSRKSKYTDFFPTVQGRYEFAPNLIARATYSTGIGRPGFLQLNAGATVDAGNLAVSVGNPSLKPTTVNAFDGAIEYYLPNSGILSVGVFDKEFKDYTLARVLRTSAYPGLEGEIVTVNSYSNIASSHARGVEAAYTQKFDHLPAPFDGLGFTGNVTYVDSRIEIRPGEFSLLPGTSKLTWNVGGFYEAHGVQVRIAAQRVSAAIFGVGGSAGADVFQDARLTADLTSSYQVTRNVQVYFNARNLLNTPLRYYEGTPNRPIQREFYDVSYEGGVRLQF